MPGGIDRSKRLAQDAINAYVQASYESGARDALSRASDACRHVEDVAKTDAGKKAARACRGLIDAITVTSTGFDSWEV
jgi:hypothetical protein